MDTTPSADERGGSFIFDSESLWACNAWSPFTGDLQRRMR